MHDGPGHDSGDAGGSTPGETRGSARETGAEAAPKPLLADRLSRVRAVVLVLVGIVSLAVALQVALRPRVPPPPAYFRLPPFALTSHEGTPFGSDQLHGRAWVAGFFFTRCPTVCPALLQRQKEIQQRTEGLGDRLQLVTISIDPEHDTPETMREHAAKQGIELRRWTLLTGETAPIQQLVRDGFKEYLNAGPGVAPEDVVHSMRFFLVDGEGQVRGLYDGLEEAEIARLVEEAKTISR